MEWSFHFTHWKHASSAKTPSVVSLELLGFTQETTWLDEIQDNRFYLVTATAVALITYLCGCHMKSFYHHETRSQLVKALNLGSTFRRFDDEPSLGCDVLSPSIVAPPPTLE